MDDGQGIPVHDPGVHSGTAVHHGAGQPAHRADDHAVSLAQGRTGVGDSARHRVDHFHAAHGHDHFVLAQPPVADIGDGRGRIHARQHGAVCLQHVGRGHAQHGLELACESGLFGILVQGAAAHGEADVAVVLAPGSDLVLEVGRHPGEIDGVADALFQTAQLGQTVSAVNLDESADLVVQPGLVHETVEGGHGDGEPAGHLHAEGGADIAEQGHLGAGFGQGPGTDVPHAQGQRPGGAGGAALERPVHGQKNVVEGLPQPLVLPGGHETEAFDHLAHGGSRPEALRPDVGYAENLVRPGLSGHLGHEFQRFVVGGEQQAEILGLGQEGRCFVRFPAVAVDEIEERLERVFHGIPPVRPRSAGGDLDVCVAADEPARVGGTEIGRVVDQQQSDFLHLEPPRSIPLRGPGAGARPRPGGG